MNIYSYGLGGDSQGRLLISKMVEGAECGEAGGEGPFSFRVRFLYDGTMPEGRFV